MKLRIRVWRTRALGWFAFCSVHGDLTGWIPAPTFTEALAAANAHARTHRRTDIASFLALRDDHPPSDRRWDTPLSHDLPEPPC